MIKRISLFIILCLPFISFIMQAENIDSLIVAENQKGVTWLREGRYEEAAKQLSYVLDLKLRYWSEDQQNLGNTYTNLGVLNKELFQFDEALTAFDKAEELFKQTDENPGKIAALLNNEASLIMTTTRLYQSPNISKTSLANN